MTARKSQFADSDRLADTAERVATRLADINRVIAGIPIYFSLSSSIAYAADDLQRDVAKYRAAREAE